MSSSGEWTTLDVIQVVGCTFGTLVAALGIAVRSNRKHRQKLEGWANELGWRIVNEDAKRVEAVAEELCPSLDFGLHLIMEAEAGERRILVADGTKSSQSHRHGVYLTGVCLVESPRLPEVAAPVEVSLRCFLDNIMPSGQVDFGLCDFSETFVVESEDPSSAYQLLTLPLQEVLLGQAKRCPDDRIDVVFGSGRALILMGQIYAQQQMADAVELARAIEAATP